MQGGLIQVEGSSWKFKMVQLSSGQEGPHGYLWVPQGIQIKITSIFSYLMGQAGQTCKTSTKEPVRGVQMYKNICYLTFTPMTDLEKELFQKCSFDQPHMSYPSPLRASDKLSPGSKSTYSNATHWLQQSKSNIDHFWKDDMALVKAIRQYHFASNILEGHTQWKFQKSHILHWVLDVIAVHMEDTKRCLDYCGTTPVDQFQVP